MPEFQKVLCDNCGFHEFEYDSAWKEYSCQKCGWIIEDAEKISVLNRMRNNKLIRKSASQDEVVKPTEKRQSRKENIKKVICPVCGGEFKDMGQKDYSVHLYKCIQCGLRKLRCGDTQCDGYMEGKLISIGYEYRCTKCGWSGVSGKKPPS